MKSTDNVTETLRRGPFSTVNDDVRKAAVRIFDSGMPVEMEIGCGKGKFIVARAEENPDIQFIALDRVLKWMKTGIRRSGKRALQNLIFLKTEAREFLTECVPAASLQACYILFPDPWPKKRHHKRRLVTADFLRTVAKRLKEGGVLFLATDHEDYFRVMEDAVSESNLPWQRVKRRVNQRETLGAVKTNYEAKYESRGKNLFYLELVK